MERVEDEKIALLAVEEHSLPVPIPPREESSQRVRESCARICKAVSRLCPPTSEAVPPVPFPRTCMGESIPNIHCCKPKPEDRYVIGEFIGVRTFYSENYSLSFIRNICGDGFLECAGTDQTSSIRVSSQAVCKIQQTFLREILRYLMAEKRLSLPYTHFLSTNRSIERECFPRLGDQVAEVNRRPLQESEAFCEGELVAVLEVSEKWIYSRVLEVAGTTIAYFKVDEGEEVARILHANSLWVRKLKGYPCLPMQRGASVTESPGITSSTASDRWIAQGALPKVSELICEFEGRAIFHRALPAGWGSSSADFFCSRSRSPDFDGLLLKRIVEAHNIQFQNRIELVTQVQGDCIGSLEEHVVSSGTKIYTCGDIHGNLSTLILILRMLQRVGLLDEQYVCVPGFLIVFLGDYIDRGLNNMQVLALLLTLRMANPDSVFLLRGNHDDANPAIHAAFGEEATTRLLLANHELFSRCFATFPLALCVASTEKYQKGPGIDQQQYVHFSHGLFSLSVDPTSLFKGSHLLFPVSRNVSFSSSWRMPGKVRKVANSAFCARFQNEVNAHNPFGYMWNDIDRTTRSFTREIGYVFSSESIDLFRKASETAAIKICLFVRGHQHIFTEHRVRRKPESPKAREKIVAITLPMNSFPDCTPKMIQGMLLTVAPRVRDWRKVPCNVHWDTSLGQFIFELESKDTGVYEPFFSQDMSLNPFEMQSLQDEQPEIM